MKTIQNILDRLPKAELRQIFWNALSSGISKKPNSLLACSTVAKAMADVKHVSLNAFQRQGSVSHTPCAIAQLKKGKKLESQGSATRSGGEQGLRRGAKVTKVLNPQSQNREHFVQDQNPEERLVRISKKSGAILVWCGGVEGHNSNHETNHSHKRVCEDGFSHGSTLKSPFEFSPVLNVFKSVKSVLFAPPPPCEPKLLPLPAKFSFSVPEPFVVMNCFDSQKSASIRVICSPAALRAKTTSASSEFQSSRFPSLLWLQKFLNQSVINGMVSNPNPDKLLFPSPITNRSVPNADAGTPIAPSLQRLKMNRGMTGISFPQPVIFGRQIPNLFGKFLQILTKILAQGRTYGHRKLLPVLISFSAASRSRSQTPRSTPSFNAESNESVSSSFFQTKSRSASESFGISSKISFTLMKLIWSTPLKSSRGSFSKGCGQIATPLFNPVEFDSLKRKKGLTSFKMQGSSSRGAAETQRNSFLNHLSSLIFTNLNPKNRANFDQNRNSNNEKNDLYKRVCESRLFHLFGFVPAAGRISPVLNAFKSVSTCPVLFVGVRVNPWLKKVLNAFSVPPTVPQSISLLGLRLIDRWTNWLLGLNRSAKSRFATVQPISPLASSLLILFILLIPVNSLFSAPPTWWTTQNVLDTTKTANDYAAVNQGQLKAVAKKAITEMNSKLPGGAGTELNDLLTTWAAANATRNDYTAVNVGQVKALAKKFYDRLNAVGVNTPYPWTAAATDDKDYAAANIGQVKNAFSFQIIPIFNNDSDNDGMFDAWENDNFGNLNRNGTLDYDGDGYTDLEEFQRGSDPKNRESKNGVIYVKIDGNDVNSGYTLPLAKKTIGGAVASTISGDTVEMISGAYPGVVVQPGTKNLILRANGTVTWSGN